MSVSVKQMDEGFLQVTNNGIDRITLGMKFRNDMEARSLMGLLQQCAAPGITVDINSNVFLSFKLGKLIAIGRLCNLCTYQYIAYVWGFDIHIWVLNSSKPSELYPPILGDPVTKHP